MRFREDIDTGGPNHFIRLKDGEDVRGILRGEIREAWVIWENKKKIEVNEGDPGARFNFQVNMVVKEGTSYVAKILEGGPQIYKQLANLSKDWELENTVIIIRRDGIELNTEYTVNPAPPKQQAPKEALEFIQTIELHDLAPQTEQKREVKNHAPTGSRF